MNDKLEILVAEDNDSMRDFLGMALKRMGYHPILMTDGREAWNYYRQNGARLVITDWLMPNMDGLELCKKIRKSPSENYYTYIILLTSRNDRQDMVTGLSAGVDDYVLKPCGTEELAARINTAERIVRLEDKHKSLNHVITESKKKLQTIFDALQEEIIAVDRNHCIVSVNNAFRHSVNMDYQELIGLPCSLVSYKAKDGTCKKYILEKIQSVFRTGIPHAFLDRYETKNQEIKFKQRTIIPIQHDDGEVYQTVIVSKDVTDTYTNTEKIKSLNTRLQKSYSAINEKNKKLEEALKRLEKTQAQVLQSEKMASIGQLAAGVAHEINNPTGFISSNLRTLQEYLKDLNTLTIDYRHLVDKINMSSERPYNVTELSGLAQDIKASERDLDIDFISEDIPQIIADCTEGTERIKQIVSDLKDFAHPGEDKVSDMDINKGIESTLNVVNNELKYKANIVKSFGDLPIIRGYPQQINQVFMNILVNAAQSIEERGEIRIETLNRGQWIDIKISDTGCGIPAEHLTRIFDPFFTTKDVGKGTGLGMNIAYNIVKKHNGEIFIDSALGKGTTFTVRLPAAQQMAEAC